MTLSQQAGEVSTLVLFEQGNDPFQYGANKTGGFHGIKFHHEDPPFKRFRGHGDCYQQCGL